MYIDSISGLVAIHSVHKQFVLAHLANEQVTSVKQILFLWGHDPNTLACKARPSFDGCGTSLSVSLSLSLSLSMFPPDTDTFCRELFHGLPAGGRLLLNGLTREQREVVHRVSHHLGLTKTSRADPSGATGARQMGVERPAQASSSIPPSTADLPQRGTRAPPSVDILSCIRQFRRRNLHMRT